MKFSRYNALVGLIVDTYVENSLSTLAIMGYTRCSINKDTMIPKLSTSVQFSLLVNDCHETVSAICKLGIYVSIKITNIEHGYLAFVIKNKELNHLDIIQREELPCILEMLSTLGIKYESSTI